MKATQSNEELREALLTLERLRAQAERRQLENQVLLEGLTHVLRSTEPDALVRDTFGSFHRLFDFDDGLILRRRGDGRLECVASSARRFIGTRWTVGPLFQRVLAGEAVATFGAERTPEWSGQPPELRAAVRSVLYAPLELERQPGIVALVSAKERAFRREHAALLERFSVLAAQTWALAEARRLREENATLEAARVEAEQASRSKSSFLATMSHELRTPMTGIFGMLHLLETSGLDPIQAGYARTLRRSADALLVLLNEVLDFSKIEAGALVLDAADFDLDEAVREAVALFEGTARSKGIALRARGFDDPPRFVKGDPLRLRQVVQNLLGNAIKFTATGFVEVRLRRTLQGSERVRLDVEVEDSGIGIPRDRVGSLFQPFVQVDGSITRQYGGTGLGLSICRRLVEAMRGQIAVESVEGRGTTFSFHVELPIGVAPPEAAGESLVAERLGRAGAPRKVLVVDDNPINREVLSAILEEIGYVPELAENGEEAVERARHEPYAAVLMDCHMPKMDGPTAVRALRALGGWCSRVPILALTADTTEDARLAFRGSGVETFLTKPVDWGALARALAECEGPPGTEG